VLRVRIIAAAGAALLAFTAAPAAAAPTPQPYGANGFAGFRDVLPPGTNGLVNALDLAQFEANKAARPAHNDDQRDMYANLVYGAPNVGAGDLSKYYKDGTFGVRPEDIASSTSPRDDVTIVRDRQVGIPHIYGSTRAGATPSPRTVIAITVSGSVRSSLLCEFPSRSCHDRRVR